ncbi:MAG: hypothetical protein ISP42_04385, partial [Alphaproteobacteria bacterium]|nr:hypothetical protein [Alphaproteobacteria bacterium]
MADIYNRARADYQAAIEQINQRGDATEHSFRTPFETLFRSLLSEPSWGITHEPGQQKGLAPDFRITKDGATVGFVECKRPGADLDSLATSDQIKNYSSLCGNILLTDYYKLLLLRDGREAGQAVLAEGQEFTDLIEQHFASVAPTGIDTAPELAEALARRARLLQGAISQELGRSAHARRLAGLFASMRELVSAEFTVAEFADTMAQMLPYALLMGRLNPDCREN